MDNKAFLFFKKLCLFNYREINVIRAVLVAISIPIFTAQLEKSREATDVANLRAAYAEGTAEVLSQADMATGWTKIYTTAGKLETSGTGVSGKATQDGWQSADPGLGWTTYNGKAGADTIIKVTYTPGTAGEDGKVTVDFAAKN